MAAQFSNCVWSWRCSIVLSYSLLDCEYWTFYIFYWPYLQISITKIKRRAAELSFYKSQITGIVRKPIIVSESKAFNLRNNFFKNPSHPLVQYPFETWAAAGSNTNKCVNTLEDNLENSVRRHKDVIVYIWTGTCVITSKLIKKEISVRKPNS